MPERTLDYSSAEPALWHRVQLKYVLGTLTVLIGLAGLFFWYGYGSPPRHGSGYARTRCASNLRQIGQGIMLYANDHQGRWPDTLDALIVSADINAECFVCPSSNDLRARGATPQEQARNLYSGGHLSFVYLGKGLAEPVHPNRVVAHEAPGHHEGAGMNVMFGDGRVQWFAESKAKQILADLAAGWNPPKMFAPVSQRAVTSQPVQ